MSVAACLLLYSFAVVVLGPGLLTRLARTGVAPRLGVTVWLVAIGSVVASWAVAAGFLAGELVRDWTQPGDTVVSACFAMLQQGTLGRYGVLVQIGLLVLAALAAAALGRLAWRLARSLLRARASTHEHARMARLAGRHVAGLEAVVLDAPERAAYCVAGRPHTIVVTSAALDALNEPHLDAVLCHERAHLAGRHHLILAVVRGMAAILPRIELFTTGAAEVARLLEMCADDAAARTHGSRTLLGALLALSDAAPIPRGALGATGVGVLTRAQRLAAPPGPVDRMRARLLLTALSALLVVGPLVTVLLTAAGFAMCDPLGG
ncbi:M56 family metallopeptidase [Actinophytocola sp. NPDC049390]|uniref:M56 family metallopeptidase n=1 Tax=Actinophytocola sp. NPDC049390 TaxID=3363894 RepID=UPI00379653F4